MAGISAITDEYLYKFKYFYRKMLPKTELFYIIFFIIKYFPLLLVTHANVSNLDPDESMFTISRIISSVTIFNNMTEFPYTTLCIIIYVVVLAIYILIGFIFYKYYTNAKKTDYVLYDIPNNKLFIPKYVKKLYKIGCVVYFIVIFFYQHIFEILTYAIFELYSNKIGLTLDDGKMSVNYTRNYMTVILNLIFMILLVLLLYFFFLFTSSETLSYTYGYQSPTSLIGIVFYCIVFSFQGLYSTTFFYIKSSQETFQLGLLYVSVVLLILNLFNNFNEINFMSTSNLAYFLRLVNNFCLCSGIFEILVHFFINKELKAYQIFWIILFVLDLSSGIIITNLVSKWQRSMSLRKLANAFFLSNKMSCPIENLFEFYLEMKNLITPQEKYLFILTLVQDHQVECNLEMCQCHKFKEFFVKLKNKEQIGKLINKFINMGEKKIMEAIVNQVNVKTDSMSLLVYTHCDFMFSIQKNMPLCLYLCQYYLIKKRKELNFKYSYLIYELNKISMKRKNEENVNDDLNVVSFIQENLIFEKIKRLIWILGTNIEKLLYYKSVKNSNSKMVFTCENIMNPLMEYVKKNQVLLNLLEYYAKRNIFEHSIEIKFIIYYHLKLFRITLPTKTMMKIYDGVIEFPSYNEIFTNNAELNNVKNNYIIIFLNCDNKFIIRYLSTEITESLQYSTSELVGSDFNEMLIPKQISQFHSIQMKQFILEGNVSFNKESFLLMKNGQLFPTKINCKILPTINTLYSMIINISEYKFDNYHNYNLILDPAFYTLFVSQSFEKDFLFSEKMLNSLNINFCDFFGANKEELNYYFQKLFNEREVDIVRKKPLAMTTNRNDELYYYAKLAEEKYLRGKLVKLVIVPKDKVSESLQKLQVGIDQSGLEKEWKKKIEELRKRIEIKDKCYGSNSNQKRSTHFFNYYLKFQFKQLGSVQYYVATISEYVEETIQLEEVSHKFPERGIVEKKVQKSMKKNKTKYEKSQSSKKKTLMATTVNETNGFTEDKDNSQANLINSLQSTTAQRHSTITGGIKNNASLTSADGTQPVMMLSQISKQTRYVRMLKLWESILFCVVFILNIISIYLGLSTMTFTQNLFYVNAYAFFMTNDIFFASLASINVCLIVNGKQTGDVDELNVKVVDGANDLMKHYHLLNERINKLIHKNQMKEIYDILNTKETYNEVKINWEIAKHESTLINELYTIHYFLQNFDVNIEDNETNCRLEEYFYELTFPDNIDYEDDSQYATNEEKLIYYITSNVVSNISSRLEYLTRTINVILNRYNKRAKTYSITFNVSILVTGALLYIVIILSIQTSRNLFRKRLVFIFTRQEKEDMFYDDIKRFKKLLENFDKKECIDYTKFKNSILGRVNWGCEDVTEYAKDGDGPRVNEEFKKSFRDKKLKKATSSSKKQRNKKELKKPQRGGIPGTFLKSDSAEDLEESLAKKEEKTAKQFYDKAEPRYVFLSMLVMLFIFGVFTIIEAINIIKNLQSYNGLMIENEFATNILSRGPKINELLLYSIISVIVNEPLYIKKDPKTFRDTILSNYYGIELELATDTLFRGLEESNFSYLYYHLHIIRTNIDYFVNDKKMKSYLETTNKNEFIFNEDSSFCLYSAVYYYQGVYEGSDIRDYFEELNEVVKKCKKVGNGMNLSGYKAGLNLMLQQLSNLYKGFVTYDPKMFMFPESRQTTFLTHSDILMMQQNIIYVIQTLHFADAFSTITDIESSYESNHSIQVLFAVLSIIFSCGVILIALLIIIRRLDFYNSIIAEIAALFETNIRKYNKQSELSY